MLRVLGWTSWLLFISCGGHALAQQKPFAGHVADAASAEQAKPLYLQILHHLQQGSGVVPDRPAAPPARQVFNREAVIPPQCYTRTEGRYNPCYVCHQDEISGRENRMNDGDLQREYSFSDKGMTNHWNNLFEDRRGRVARISDEEILRWINTDNYTELATRLRQAEFKGWVPDLRNLDSGSGAFDEFGHALDGSGWVAFNYKPVPSSFWPTNGSTDDVMIRLPAEFQRSGTGELSRDIYQANLAILEASIKELARVSVPPLDERAVGMDLNGDGRQTVITEISQTETYVGAAQQWFKDDSLYPLGTEFLHTVRYVGVSADHGIGVSRRMKEVRYMRKAYVMPRVALDNAYLEESWAKEAGYLPGYTDLGPHGLDNGMGWVISGFIEDRDGRLRANTYEENLFCMGCHTSIGSTIDKVFSFARKVDGLDGWGYINLRGMPDAPNRGEQLGEIATYLQRVGGGGEFRSNVEMQSRWFRDDGSADLRRIAEARDVYELITPSRRRALDLNKAYRVIVSDQDYLFGRDATLSAPSQVYREIDNRSAPTLAPQHIYRWDIRLDWSRPEEHGAP